MQRLVIVESPKKAELIQGFLKEQKLKGYKVMASAGHIRDLKEHSFGVDIDNNFAPEYEVSPDKKHLVAELKREVKKSEVVYLASDEDREGEAISWHLSEVLGLTPEQRRRIVFHEITSEAFMHALDHPRDINQDLVDAQQARRVLDRIVGFELSPVLWRRLKPKLSAGRVQSVAVRLIVDREREINAFKARSSYRVQAMMALSSGVVVKSELNHRFETEQEAQAFLELCRHQTFTIGDIVKKQAKRSPSAPFTTSTLQQEASSRLGYPVTHVMRLAQNLYESGYITYMRTDSVNLSSSAMASIAKEIKTRHGDKYYQPRSWQTKSKGAQEAHEAIRPTYLDRIPSFESDQERKLYELIRRRTLASQMADAQIERTSVTIPVEGSPYQFVAQGEVIVFRGYLDVYMDEDGDEAKLLPMMQIGEQLVAQEIRAVERFSQRPARYTEASMVSKMEELGIGRPSTYAPTIQTIQKRGYVERGERAGIEREFVELVLQGDRIGRSLQKETYGSDKGKLIPTDTGVVVNDFLVDHFPSIVDFNFTAKVEEEFDHVAEGDLGWQEMIGVFYQSFHPRVEEATQITTGTPRVGARELGVDPESGRKVFAALGRYGSMVQIGTSEDEEKPRYASLPPGQTLETITLQEALALFALPKVLGEFEGKEVSVAVGRFGPYVKHDGAFASLPKGGDPHVLSLQEAIDLIVEKRDAKEKSLLRTFDDEPDLQVLQGRFGPYIKYQGSNYKLPKGVEIDSLSLEDCQQIIAQAGEATKKTARGGRRALANGSASSKSKSPARSKASKAKA